MFSNTMKPIHRPGLVPEFAQNAVKAVMARSLRLHPDVFGLAVRAYVEFDDKIPRVEYVVEAGDREGRRIFRASSSSPTDPSHVILTVDLREDAAAIMRVARGVVEGVPIDGYVFLRRVEFVSGSSEVNAVEIVDDPISRSMSEYGVINPWAPAAK